MTGESGRMNKRKQPSGRQATSASPGGVQHLYDLAGHLERLNKGMQRDLTQREADVANRVIGERSIADLHDFVCSACWKRNEVAHCVCGDRAGTNDAETQGDEDDTTPPPERDSSEAGPSSQYAYDPHDSEDEVASTSGCSSADGLLRHASSGDSLASDGGRRGTRRTPPRSVHQVQDEEQDPLADSAPPSSYSHASGSDSDSDDAAADWMAHAVAQPYFRGLAAEVARLNLSQCLALRQHGLAAVQAARAAETRRHLAPHVANRRERESDARVAEMDERHPARMVEDQEGFGVPSYSHWRRMPASDGDHEGAYEGDGEGGLGSLLGAGDDGAQRGDSSHGLRSDRNLAVRLEKDGSMMKYLHEHPQSPDINPIEGCWLVLEERLN
ncbi:hypothetical protein LTR85_005470 [Meristemomyces frigidus]|nr:hypothetical protein LTR85_005470 [Meristemomyces frigidus]